MTASQYSRAFYDDQEGGSRASAEVVVPLILEYCTPRSVVDVGCGVGGWLVEFKRHGVADVLGVDGDYVPADRRRIPKTEFRAADLARPIDLGRRFDLACCLEVGEHLPAASAAGLVGSLVKLSDVVVFSAAVPHQGGTGHVNEQWPAYWAAQFAQHGYQCCDALRPRIWSDPRVDWWYAQNLLFFVAQQEMAAYPRLAGAAVERPLSLVHPNNYLQHADPGQGSLRRALSSLPRLIVRRLFRTGSKNDRG